MEAETSGEKACRYCLKAPDKCPGYGLCHCGCGQPAKLSEIGSTSRGWVRGEPRKYLAGHFRHGGKPRCPSSPYHTEPLSLSEIRRLLK